MEAGTLSPTAKSEFRNDSGGHCGVVVIENGREKALPLAPGDKVLLTAQEQILTANAPKKDEDNPFKNGTLTLTTPAAEIANRRPIGDASVMPGATVATPEETEEARVEREAKARAAAERVEKREAEATKQAQTGAKPRVETPPAKSEGEGAVPAPKPPTTDETAVKPQEAPTDGERAAAEEVATPEAEKS